MSVIPRVLLFIEENYIWEFPIFHLFIIPLIFGPKEKIIIKENNNKLLKNNMIEDGTSSKILNPRTFKDNNF